MKKTLLVTVAAVSLLALAACGQKSSDATTGKSSESKTEKITAKITAVNTQKKTLNKFLPPVYCHCLSLYFGVNHLKINFRHQGTSPLKIKTIFLPSGNTLII